MAPSAHRIFQTHCAIKAFHPVPCLPSSPTSPLSWGSSAPSRVPPLPGRPRPRLFYAPGVMPVLSRSPYPSMAVSGSPAGGHPEMPRLAHSSCTCLIFPVGLRKGLLGIYYFSVPGISAWPCPQAITGFGQMANLRYLVAIFFRPSRDVLWVLEAHGSVTAAVLVPQDCPASKVTHPQGWILL